MNETLWQNILSFELDNPPSEYGFSTRLANENYWTKNFTAQAILEYKKFMYLAAVNERMVSPSEIIDTVWHQHLIFTQSYQEFCNVLGKQIQHIPSTHNKEEAEKFGKAKERTEILYREIFGDAPITIWGFAGMYESLRLNKATMKLRSFIIIGILAFAVLVIPFYFLLRPVYVSIDNPYFLILFTALVIGTFIFLEFLNTQQLKKIADQFHKQSFIFDLQPYELIYLKTQNLNDIVAGTVNELVENKVIRVNEDYSLEFVQKNTTKTSEQLQTTVVLSEAGSLFYGALLNQLRLKPIFWNIANSMDAFKKYFIKSKKFAKLFYFNFVVLSAILMLGFIRLVTGALREKPVLLIVGGLGILVYLLIQHLQRLTKLMCTKIIPSMYENELAPAYATRENWQWQYFLRGKTVLAMSFVPLVDAQKKYAATHDDNGSSCGASSCGSSCGSSCSSCGGCGGGD